MSWFKIDYPSLQQKSWSDIEEEAHELTVKMDNLLVQLKELDEKVTRLEELLNGTN